MSIIAFILIVSSATLHVAWNTIAKKSHMSVPLYTVLCTVSCMLWFHVIFWTPVKILDLSPKVFLLYYAVQNNQKIVSCMGAGGKMHPDKIEIADIDKSHHCHLAFYIRKKLHKLGIRTGIKVVFSPEPVNKSAVIEEESQNKASNVGTISYMPAAFGCFCASVVINGLLEKPE